jgi:adenylate cyclase
LIGLGFLYWPVTANWEKQGLDSLFKLRGALPQPPDVRVVAIDEDSRWIRGLEPGVVWPRDLHGELVRVLAREGARSVAFDVLFDAAGDPDQTQAFRDGLVESGNVVLGSTVDQIDDPKFKQTRLIEPYGPLAEAAAAVGEVDLPEDRDGVIRHTWLYHDDRPSLALAAYEVATGDLSLRERGARLIDYYGRPRTVPTVSIYQALEPGEYLAPGYFRDKVVFVGASEVAATDTTDEKDSFRTPFFGGEVGSTWGVEIHATIAANLLEERRIGMLGPALEAAMLLLLPLLATFTFIYLRPVFGAFALIAFELVPWAASWFAFTREDLWLPVLIPSLVQLPIAYVVSLVWYYLTTARERERIRRAFAFYLSPDMIRRVTESPDELDLGGEEIVGTAMFTDIKGFTSIAEGMTAPETAALLNDYFSEATSHVFGSGGTLIKYIGDAVFAIWGAPLRMDDHATPACRAAVGMSRLQQQIGDRPAGKLVTRIGVHTGSMLVGNLGSSQRFDYTAIGDTINLAARLESINKRFGTQTLVSGEALAATDGSLIARPLGHIRVVGRGEPVAIHELLGISGETTRPNAQAIERFERALEDFSASRFEEAADGFREVRELCGGDDGPSEFYLGTIDRLVAEPPPEGWNGVITFETK